MRNRNHPGRVHDDISERVSASAAATSGGLRSSSPSRSSSARNSNSSETLSSVRLSTGALIFVCLGTLLAVSAYLLLGPAATNTHPSMNINNQVGSSPTAAASQSSAHSQLQRQHARMQLKRIVIVGGGLAGMSAAITILEVRRN